MLHFMCVHLCRLPFYYELKIVFVLWLALPYTEVCSLTFSPLSFLHVCLSHLYPSSTPFFFPSPSTLISLPPLSSCFPSHISFLSSSLPTPPSLSPSSSLSSYMYFPSLLPFSPLYISPLSLLCLFANLPSSPASPSLLSSIPVFALICVCVCLTSLHAL